MIVSCTYYTVTSGGGSGWNGIKADQRMFAIVSNLPVFIRRLCYYSGIPLDGKFVEIRLGSLVGTTLLTTLIILDIVMKLLMETELTLEERVLCVHHVLIFTSIYIARLDFMLKAAIESDVIDIFEGRDSLFMGRNYAHSFLQKEHDELHKLAGLIFGIVCLMGLLAFLFPVLGALFIVLTGDQNELGDSLPLMIPSYYSKQVHSNLFYALTSIVHLCLIYSTISFGASTVIMSFCSMHVVTSDIKLLCFLAEKLGSKPLSTGGYLREGNRYFKKNVNEIESKNNISNLFEEEISHQEGDDIMRMISTMHQSVHRKIQVLNKGLGLITLLMCNTFCFQICVCVYCTMQVEDIQVKVQYFILVTPVTYIMYALCNYSQKMINESENLKHALWSTAWVDMPSWKRKNLLVIMALASKQMDMRGCGVFVMNLKMFSNIMHSAYSYYNLLNAV